jgi:hypothetical protein
MKIEALDSSLWRTCFGRGYGPVVRHTTEWMKKSLEWAAVTFPKRFNSDGPTSRIILLSNTT